MPFNQLILPLVGGYFFLIATYFTRYFHQRVENQRLLLHSALAGTILILLAYIIVRFISNCAPDLKEYLVTLLPPNQPYLGTSLIAFTLGVILPFLINYKYGKKESLIYAIKRSGNDLQNFLLDSALEENFLMITLKSKKVYVGYVLRIRSNMDYISMVPILSGYRDDNLELILTNSYIEVFESKDKFENIISTSEILYAGTFHFDLYENDTSLNK